MSKELKGNITFNIVGEEAKDILPNACCFDKKIKIKQSG